jgi:type II secretory pathway predicted ATPase ExeA
MIHQFFGLREQPFGVTPDPRYLYFGPGHREALASLVYGIEMNRGFLALIARPGMGKTTLLFHLLEKFRHSARTAFLFQTQCSSRELLRFLLAEFGIESTEKDPVRMHERLNRYLIEQSSAGRRVIVVIDEAQNLEPSVLETVRLLSNFETPRAKLLQIILSGQPELATKLASPSLSQFRQRIASFNGLQPLAPQEVGRFIDHRLHVAGYQGPPLFSDKAKAMIAGLSEGIPRSINSLCFGALSLACALRQKTIDPAMVHEVSGDLDLQELASGLQRLTVPHHSRTWSSQLPEAKLSPLPEVRLPEVRPTPAEARPAAPTEVVALSGSRSNLDRANHDGDITSVPANYEAPRPSVRKPAQSLLSRVIGFAVLVLMVGIGATKVTAPAVEIANTWPLPKPENVAPPTIVKTSETEAAKPATAKTLPEEVQHPAVAPAELRKHVNEGDAPAETRLPAPAFEIANTRPLPSPENVVPPSIVKTSDNEAVKPAPAKTPPEQVQNPAVDPAELWKRVQVGNTGAEVQLAVLYLEGSVVGQSCEQAHLLLVAASKKGSKVASDLLSGKYAERCH